MAAHAQSVDSTGAAPSFGSIATSRPINPATGTTNPSARPTQTLNPYLGSTPDGAAVDEEIKLTLEDAVARGLRPSAVSVTDGPGVNSSASIHTIAVMPFSDLSRRRNQAYLCDGFAEQLIHLLSQIPSVRVVARASVFELRAANMSVRRLDEPAAHEPGGDTRISGYGTRVDIEWMNAAGMNAPVTVKPAAVPIAAVESPTVIEERPA